MLFAVFRHIYSMEDITSSHGDSQLPWHAAFFQAMQAELFDYRDVLVFESEHQITTEPLRIDLLVIKKTNQLAIAKNIARIFRAINLVEYKSPDDYLSVKDFFKAIAYANLYAATSPDADLSDLTITFVGNRKPRSLIKYLSTERGYVVEETSPGIHFIAGAYIPIQIIESKKLPESENLWLNSLVKGLKTHRADAIFKENRRWQNKLPLDVYWDVVLEANYKAFMEVFEMQTMAFEEAVTEELKMRNPRFEELFTKAGIIPKWVARGEAKGIEQGKAEVARNLLAIGMSMEKIAQVTELPIEAVQALQMIKDKS